MSLRFDGRVVLVTVAVDDVTAICDLLTERGATVVRSPGRGATLEATMGDHGRLDAVIHALSAMEARPGSAGAVDFGAIDRHTEALQDLFDAVHPAWAAMAERGSGGQVVIVWPPGGSGDDPLSRLGTDAQSVTGMGASGLAGVLKLEGAGPGLRTNVVVPLDADPASPALPALVAYLAHEDCTLNGAVLAVADGGVRRLVIGVTPGDFNAEISTEWVARRGPELAAATDFVVPDQGGGEMPLLKRHFT